MADLPQIYAENIADWLPELLAACLVTLRIAAAAFVLAVLVGLLVALARISRLRWLRLAAICWIEVGRGLPALVVLYIVYYVPPQLFPGQKWAALPAFTAAVLGLGLQGAAFLAEVFRSGIEALQRGQTEAALSLGMTPAKAMAYIVLPQAMRIVMPPVGNYAIGLLKDTAVAVVIAAAELMNVAKDLASSSFQPMAVYLLAAALYFVMSYPLSLGVRYMEARISRHR
jgi:His/Glu/Gln/Arg/opine family amino acid ABC transporter permease subunit